MLEEGPRGITSYNLGEQTLNVSSSFQGPKNLLQQNTLSIRSGRNGRMEFCDVVRFIQFHILLPHLSGLVEDLESLVHVYHFHNRMIEGRCGMWGEFSMWGEVRVGRQSEIRLW